MPAAKEKLTPRSLRTKPLKVYGWIEMIDGEEVTMLAAATHIDEIRGKYLAARQPWLEQYPDQPGYVAALRNLGSPVCRDKETGEWYRA